LGWEELTMSIQTKSINSALVYYDDRYTNRLIDAVGANVVKWELPVGVPKDDTTDDPSGLVNTETGTNTVLSSTTAGDRLTVTTGATEYNGVNLQVHGSAFKLESGKPCYFGARIAVQNGSKGDYLIGLCEVDTTLLATATAHALSVTDDGVFFYQLNDETSFAFVNELGGTEGEIATGITTGNSTYHDLEFYYDGAVLYAYANGSEIGSVASGIADQALTPSINVRTGDDGAEILYVQWMRAIQIR
jgi:hypothetical protein